jgi:chemotaxis protein MotB
MAGGLSRSDSAIAGTPDPFIHCGAGREHRNPGQRNLSAGSASAQELRAPAAPDIFGVASLRRWRGLGMRRAKWRRMRTFHLVTGAVVLAAAAGCVSTGKYDAAVSDAQRARTELGTTRSELDRERADSKRSLAEKDAELAQLKEMMSQAEARCAQTARELDSSRAGALGCSQALDGATALNQQLRQELERQGKDVDQLLSARGALASSLEQARARLDELRRAQAATEARAALFRELALRFKRMLDAGELQLTLRSGRMVLALPTDILFPSGKAVISARGKEALAEVGAVLATLADRRFQVAGHTDNDPIRYSGYASNWELSSERALQVMRFLVQSGMAPATLSAAAYGEYDPVIENDTPEHKARNRRIEITLQPRIDELPSLPE